MFIARLQVGTVALLIVAALARAAAMASSRARSIAFPSGRCPAARLPPPYRLPYRSRFATAAMSTRRPRKPTTAWGDSFVQTKGRVLTPDGKPIAGTQITLWWYSVIGYGWHHHTFQEARPRVLATTGPDGTFEASFPKSVMANAYSTCQTQRPWSWAEIVAGADGYGPAWGSVDSETNVYELKLVPDDVPVPTAASSISRARAFLASASGCMSCMIASEAPGRRAGTG